jgi:hypothetical protein
VKRGDVLKRVESLVYDPKSHDLGLGRMKPGDELGGGPKRYCGQAFS